MAGTVGMNSGSREGAAFLVPRVQAAQAGRSEGLGGPCGVGATLPSALKCQVKTCWL